MITKEGYKGSRLIIHVADSDDAGNWSGNDIFGSKFMNDGFVLMDHEICLGWYKCTETGSTEAQIQWHLLSVKGHYFKYQDEQANSSALLLLC